MLLVREIMYCKPGQVRPMVDKFVAMSALMESVRRHLQHGAMTHSAIELPRQDQLF